MEFKTIVAIGMVFALLFLSFSVGTSPDERAAAAPPSFVVSFAGDFPAYSGFSAALAELNVTNSTFALALGDLGYGLVNESTWCAKFHRHFANVEIVAGSRDTGAPPPTAANINNFANDCPFTLNVPVIGSYGKEYYFDYPFDNPLARFILISPDLRFYDDAGSPLYNYSLGTPHYNWTAQAIDDARSLGIPWVFVGMAKDCIAAGEHPCEIGTDLFNLLLEKKVDVILQTHTHNYERSKGLAMGPGCSGVQLGSYNATCVSEDGANGTYEQGSGSVLVISGTGGRDVEAFNESGVFAPYFAAWMGSNSQNPQSNAASTYASGFPTFTVSATKISMRTTFNVSYQDSFTINGLPRSPSGSTSGSGTGSSGILGDFLVGAAIVAAVAVALVAVLTWRRKRKGQEPPEEDL